MSKLFKDVSKMVRNLRVIEQYNNFKQLNAIDDITFLKEKVNNLYNIKNEQELIKEFTWCCKMVNSYYNEIESDFKKYYLQEERKELN